MAGLSGSETGRGARGWSFLAGTVALVTAVTLWLTAVPTAAAPVAVRSVGCGFSEGIYETYVVKLRNETKIVRNLVS